MFDFLLSKTFKAAVDYKTLPFFVEDISGEENTLSIINNGSGAPSINVQVSTDGITWESMGTTSTSAITATIPANGRLYLRANATNWGSGAYYNHFSASKNHNIGGNILSLLQGSSFTGQTQEMPTGWSYRYAFMCLFMEDNYLISAENLILTTTVTDYCYNLMFKNCASLTTAPKILPALSLTNGAETYKLMFQNCTSLTTAPELPALTLVNYCYYQMFYGCTSLTTAPKLPATTVYTNSYAQMFYNCTSLISAPELPAEPLDYNCYYEMFYGCSSLTTAPSLPSTSLAHGCYQAMFERCTSLTTAPDLPATTLQPYCYYQMFERCTSLTTAPDLPATQLFDYCYYRMFCYCQNLNYIKCLANNIPYESCTSYWLYSVAASGLFIKNADMESWIVDVNGNGIPLNWTVQNAN